MNESQQPKSNLTGCAISYIVTAFVLTRIANISWTPRWAQVVLAALVGLGLIALNSTPART